MQGWTPMLYFPTNLPEFPPALRRKGRSIIVEFYDPTDHFEAARHLDRGVAHFEAGEYDEAVEALDASLELAQGLVAALFYKGVALAKLCRHGEALKSYDAALDLNPGDAEILFNKGITLDELGRPDDAIVTYDEALATESDHAGTLTNKGAILAEQGRDEAALRALGAALDVRPGKARRGRGGLRGRARYQTGTRTRAVLQDRRSGETGQRSGGRGAFARRMEASGGSVAQGGNAGLASRESADGTVKSESFRRVSAAPAGALGELHADDPRSSP